MLKSADSGMTARPRRRRTFVLVHGAWHGGWCYRKVATLLRDRGHDVYTPTLTGLGERSHLIDHPINCSTHIQDVVNVFEWEDLSEVILCGHSYGGAVVSGVADRIPARIAALVYLDAMIPQSGKSIADMIEDSKDGVTQQITEEIAAPAPETLTQGYGLMQPVAAAVFNVNMKDRASVDRLCTPQPLATFTEKLQLVGNHLRIPKKVCILATDWGNDSARQFFDRIEDKADWSLIHIACGHNVMMDEPEELARILEESC